jgi:copper chaperone CopZ
MEQLDLAVPAMWADHHVLAVRAVLSGQAGVSVTAASALDGTVHLDYDPAQTDAGKIAAALATAGYPVGDASARPAAAAELPSWGAAGSRVTATDPADLTMSGDHRKY